MAGKELELDGADLHQVSRHYLNRDRALHASPVEAGPVRAPVSQPGVVVVRVEVDLDMGP